MLRRIEGPEYQAATIREIFTRYWGVEIGMYSHGAWFEPYVVDPHTSVGRYCSIAPGARILNHNHPLSFKSTSGLFFNPAMKLSRDWRVEHRPLEIGNDVWIGANAVVMPEVDRIGDGAVIGAGAVVTRDVPPYAVVLGNPGRVVKYRFSPETIADLLEERWWDKDVQEIRGHLHEFQVPLEATPGADRAQPVVASTGAVVTRLDQRTG
jgi:acetyltransferase-like isoleucine patch superfamily enzyme